MYVFIYIYIYIFIQEMAFERLMLHINAKDKKMMMMIIILKEYSSFEIGI